MTTSRRIACALCACATIALHPSLSASSSSQHALGEDALAVVASWVAVDAVTGYERRVAPALAAALGWQADAYGNVVTSIGRGTPHRIVACALDRPGYAVSQIRDDGYLRLHRIGSGSRHPLWDQQFEAQQVRVMTKAGPVAGVVARANGHFGAQHRHETRVVTADDLWLDVGAESRADVEAFGIELLDPVSRQLPAWPIAGGVAGPDAGRRAGCAAVASLAAAVQASAAQLHGRVTFVMSAQQVMGWIGLSSLIARGERPDAVIVLAPGSATRTDDRRATASLRDFGDVVASTGVSDVRWLAPAVEQAGSHMEVVRGDEIGWLRDAAAEAAGLRAARAEWVAAPAPAPLITTHHEPGLADLADELTALVDLYGVSGHETMVGRAVLAALPAWARDRAVVDDLGNITVEAGPPGPATVFMAHLDEVGYVVESIAEDGTVTLASRGGALGSAWEGQTALLHLPAPADEGDAPQPIRGVFRVRDTADTRHPGQMRAWFGLDAAALKARGAARGMPVTNVKHGLRLGRTRYVGRALDDRAGTLALVRALHRITPTQLPGRVVFAWSVQEETGLYGAAAMAQRLGRETVRIYSVDTFVSSDTPLESPHFAYTPLGRGPVLRAIENSGVSPDGERARVRRIAAAAGIPLQIGLTQGGTDGTAFTFRGAPNQGLSWPGRYSHSPGEVLDLRDLDALVRLIVEVATGSDGN